MKFLTLLGLTAFIHCASAMNQEQEDLNMQEAIAASLRDGNNGNQPPKAYRDYKGEKYEPGEIWEREQERIKSFETPKQNDLPKQNGEPDDEKYGLGGQEDEEELGGGGLDDEDEEDYTLISRRDEENPMKFIIPQKCVMMCNLVKNIIEGDQTAKEIEIKKVSGPILKFIVDYLTQRNGKLPAEIGKPIRSLEMRKIAEFEEDADYIDAIGQGWNWGPEGITEDMKRRLEQLRGNGERPCPCTEEGKRIIFQIILGANYMDIKSLLHLACAKVATMIKGKSPEEIKKILGDDDGAQAGNHARNEGFADRRRRLSKIFGLPL